ncbi:hypothetical protein EDEG_01821 [Edhazardia aedis USNM 41457]|uniref:Uncharacterized protein n=1 Tax=Edhazardia aedis (strain USNM 41457) TaxID=1003232 RepID=J9D8P2_EDHAE|nr:hypothetical protein EDEG_01821 [Edhazardia aedis USNM 41457]|eukprot:EJW03884.1 hypothetical protein EDEG_01821 [Edhazardia aedis USNM 41457]
MNNNIGRIRKIKKLNYIDLFNILIKQDVVNHIFIGNSTLISLLKSLFYFPSTIHFFTLQSHRSSLLRSYKRRICSQPIIMRQQMEERSQEWSLRTSRRTNPGTRYTSLVNKTLFFPFITFLRQFSWNPGDFGKGIFVSSYEY